MKKKTRHRVEAAMSLLIEANALLRIVRREEFADELVVGAMNYVMSKTQPAIGELEGLMKGG